MNTVTDPRVVFYLRHQRLIDEWASVRSDAQDAAHRFFLSLDSDVAELAGRLEGVEPEVRDATYSRVCLFRPEWFAPTGELLVLVGLEWRRSDATFVDGTRLLGVRVDAGVEAGRSLRPLVGDRVRHLRTNAGFPESTSYWAAYRDAPTPDGDYWDDLSGLREKLVDSIRLAWESFSAPIDEAFRDWKSTA